MLCRMKRMPLLAAAIVAMLLMSTAQTQPQREGLLIQGYSGQATVVRSQGRALVDVQDLARITNGSLSFEGNRITLTIPPSTAAERPNRDSTDESGFSPAFRRAAIEAMASMREWGGMLKVIVENGYPVGKAIAGNTIRAYEGRAADSLALAGAAASKGDDHRALELLTLDFTRIKSWADHFVEARNSLNAAELSTSEDPLKDDEDAQKVLACGQFLAQMFASGTLKDDPICR
jgi:hypothetical protein